MDSETFYTLVFMIFGLGFFIFMIHIVTSDNNRQHERDLQRDREFGLREPRPLFSFHRTKTK